MTSTSLLALQAFPHLLLYSKCCACYCCCFDYCFCIAFASMNAIVLFLFDCCLVSPLFSVAVCCVYTESLVVCIAMRRQLSADARLPQPLPTPPPLLLLLLLPTHTQVSMILETYRRRILTANSTKPILYSAIFVCISVERVYSPHYSKNFICSSVGLQSVVY